MAALMGSEKAMNELRRRRRWAAVTMVLLASLGAAVWGAMSLTTVTSTGTGVATKDDDKETPDSSVAVQIANPSAGLTQRVTTQPGTVEAFESVRLYAKVPGFLKSQAVDIGSKVKKDEILAVVDVPELEAQRRRAAAGVRQAQSRVGTMQARIKSAQADLAATKAEVTRAEAAAKSASAWVRFRALQLKRMESLFQSRSIEEKLVDESKEQYEASLETERSGMEAITSSKARVDASAAKIEQASAELGEAQADVEVAQAELEKAEVQVAFAKVTAPFDGVVTKRNFNVGAYIRSANDGGNLPLLTVQRTDLMRVVVQVPDRDVPLTEPGKEALIRIDALPGRQMTAKVSRIADHEDPQTRLMRVEIDLPNPDGAIRDGMYGEVTIILDRNKDGLSVPSSSVVRKASGEKSVFVVRDGKAQQLAVKLGADNGLRASVLEGVTASDQVIVHPPGSLTSGQAVTVLTK
jgi:HlyD family secretion protein